MNDPLTTPNTNSAPTDHVHDLPVDAWQRECLDLNPELLSPQMERMAGQVAYWNVRFADAQREFNRATRKRHELRARIRMELRASAAKMTVEALGDALEIDERYIAAQEECF